jgi:uncharacterized protein YyaL (SSP411 family)
MLNLLILLLLPTTAVTASPLADSGSPYLRLHAEDAVKWRTWDAEALAEARRSDRLLFLSIGYYACHWCHVMQRESFQDPTVGAYINRHYVPVKIDREVEPVLDEQMMQFMEATRGQGGWPLNVFLTPEGYPLVGTVYLPRDDFLDFVQRLQGRWQAQAPALAVTAREGWDALHDQPAVNKLLPAPLDPDELRARFVANALQRADELSGGFGYQTKFPHVPQLRGLLATLKYDREPRVDEFLRLTLDAMLNGGLRDHVGEGFFRYTVDPQWQIPHFEKMLYDNAQLARLYLEAAVILDEPRYRDAGLATLHFVLEVMGSRAGGGYIASLSALDENDVEGGYYLWEPEAVREAAGEHWPVVERAWGLDLPRSLEAGYLPHLQRPVEMLAAEFEMQTAGVIKVLDATASSLRAPRATRGLPRDGKRLAGWNGLLLSGLVEAGAAGDGRSLQAARDLVAWMRESLWKDGGLRRGVDADGRSLGPGVLADYAYVVEGIVAYARLTGDPAAWDWAEELANTAWSRFQEDGMWTPDPGSLLPGQVMVRMTPDDVLPSATALVLLASAAVAEHFDDADLKARVQQLADIHTTALEQAAFDHATFITRVLSVAALAEAPGDEGRATSD